MPVLPGLMLLGSPREDGFLIASDVDPDS